MTFTETQTLCDGVSISGHSIDEINAVVDLKHAWEWIFDNYDRPVKRLLLSKTSRKTGNN